MNILIIAMLERGVFLKYAPLLKEVDSLEREWKILLELLTRYFEKYSDQTSLTIDELELFYNQCNPASRDKEMFGHIFNSLRAVSIINKDLIGASLDQIADHHFSSKIMKHLIEFIGKQNTVGVEGIFPILDEYKEFGTCVKKLDENRSSGSLREIMTEIKNNGLSWSIEPLNNVIGPVYPGTLGHVFARPEIGKTAFGVAQIAWFAYQLRSTDKTLLYLANEEAVSRTKSRVYSSLLGESVWRLLEQRDDVVEDLFEAKGGNKIRFMDGINTTSLVEEALVKYKPFVVIIDQGPKITIGGVPNDVAARQQVYQHLRELAKKYNCIILCLGQADSAAHNKKWVHYNHIDCSKVGIPGECDYIIGIGFDEKTLDSGLRYFLVSKNKLGMKSGRFTAKLEVEKNRFVV